MQSFISGSLMKRNGQFRRRPAYFISKDADKGRYSLGKKWQGAVDSASIVQNVDSVQRKVDSSLRTQSIVPGAVSKDPGMKTMYVAIYPSESQSGS